MIEHSIPPSLLARIGDMTVSFALLELSIQHLMSSLINDSPRVGQILASYLKFSNLRAATLSLYLDRHGEDIFYNTMKRLMNLSGKIEEERNRITHSVWGASQDSIVRIKVTARESRGFHVAWDEYDEEKLVKLNAHILDTTEQLILLRQHLISQGKAFDDPSETVE